MILYDDVLTIPYSNLIPFLLTLKYAVTEVDLSVCREWPVFFPSQYCVHFHVGHELDQNKQTTTTKKMKDENKQNQ